MKNKLVWSWFVVFSALCLSSVLHNFKVIPTIWVTTDIYTFSVISMLGITFFLLILYFTIDELITKIRVKSLNKIDSDGVNYTNEDTNDSI